MEFLRWWTPILKAHKKHAFLPRKLSMQRGFPADGRQEQSSNDLVDPTRIAGDAAKANGFIWRWICLAIWLTATCDTDYVNTCCVFLDKPHLTNMVPI